MMCSDLRTKAGEGWGNPAPAAHEVRSSSNRLQFCDAEDGTQKGVGAGETFTWDIISNVARQGRRLQETQPMPETSFTVSQGSLTVTEWGQSVH